MGYKDLLKLIYKKSPLQKKRIESYLSTKKKDFFDDFDNFVNFYGEFLKKKNLDFEFLIEGYLEMCTNMMRSQIYFAKTGKYPQEDETKIFHDLYDNKNKMLPLMLGLALSQYLWPSHYEIFSHFKDLINKYKNKKIQYLEIGPGHGLFLKYAIEVLNKENTYDIVDISETSINITKEIIDKIIKNHNLNFFIKDINEFKQEKKYDIIIAGEVLEHLNQPDFFLKKLSNLLNKNGKLFLTTCVNCPTIDHVLHFKSINEVHLMLNKNGFIIENEKILPAENLSLEEIIRQKITINYSCILKNG